MTKQNKHNPRHIMGYDNFKDIATTLILLNNKNLFLSLFAVITTFITGYIYDSASAVYLMLGMILVDFITGCAYGIKNKEFKSSKLQRIAAPLVLYPLILSFGWNIAKYSDIYSFLPATIYAIFVGTLFTSIIENLIKLKWISGDVLLLIKEKIKEKIK